MDLLEKIDKVANSPLAKTAKFVWDAYVAKHQKRLREYILRDIRQGDFSRVHDDDIIAISYRLHKDAIEGVAKNNLRLLCRLISGLNDADKLIAPTFLKYATILESLTTDELKVIAYDIWLYNNPKPDEQALWKIGKPRFDEKEQQWKRIQQAFIKSINIKMDEYETTQMTLLRTGLYRLEYALDPQGANLEYPQDWLVNPIFSITPLMVELMEYVDFQIDYDE